jgi:hypothetical protein
MGSGAVSRPQRYGLVLWVLSACFFFSASARSLASPCGPSGRGSILTSTVGNMPPEPPALIVLTLTACSGFDPRGTGGSAVASKPAFTNSCTSALAAFSQPIVPFTTIPSGSLLVPKLTGPRNIFITDSGSVGCQLADWRAVPNSSPKVKASVSPRLYDSHVRSTGKALSLDASVLRARGPNFRHATDSSAATRAVCSSSVSLRNASTSWFDLLRNSEFMLRDRMSIARSAVFIDSIISPAPSSTTTPPATRMTLASSTPYFLKNCGLAEERNTPKYDNLHMVQSSACLCRISLISNNTPIATSAAPTKPIHSQNGNDASIAAMDLSRADMELSNAEMHLSNAEVSVGKSEARLAKITIALLLVPIGYGIWIVIVAEREERVHKKFIKSRYRA